MKKDLDSTRLGQKEEAHAYLKEQLELPLYYGNNLDALYDCLTELDEMEIEFHNVECAGAYFDQVYRVFEKAEEENTGLHIKLTRS